MRELNYLSLRQFENIRLQNNQRESKSFSNYASACSVTWRWLLFVLGILVVLFWPLIYKVLDIFWRKVKTWMAAKGYHDKNEEPTKTSSQPTLPDHSS